ncbi:MAG: MGMT family protein [Bacteroidota bacterium]|nr:MGMT family protein [Bacteroidota bacterium]
MEREHHQDLYERVYRIVQQIPRGKVTTYGHIARALGVRSGARLVGWALNAAKFDPEIPCHRVVNQRGELTGKMHFATPTLMRELLEGEGVRVSDNRVDLHQYLWVPPVVQE